MHLELVGILEEMIPIQSMISLILIFLLGKELKELLEIVGTDSTLGYLK